MKLYILSPLSNILFPFFLSEHIEETLIRPLFTSLNLLFFKDAAFLLTYSRGKLIRPSKGQVKYIMGIPYNTNPKTTIHSKRQIKESIEIIEEPAECNELTAYFLTTGRQHANEALKSLRAQKIPRIVVVRNIMPLAKAHLPTLACETEFCLVLDDDVVLKPDVVPKLLDEFRRQRQVEPRGFKLNARIFIEVEQRFGKGGLKLFHTASLKDIGWPDAPHVSYAQGKIAERLGYVSLKCSIEAGIQKRGSDVDVYKNYLWIELRARAGQHPSKNLKELVRLAQETGDRRWWLAALGVVDARAIDIVSTSKDEDFLGPLGASLNLDEISNDRLCEILVAHRAADEKSESSSLISFRSSAASFLSRLVASLKRLSVLFSHRFKCSL